MELNENKILNNDTASEATETLADALAFSEAAETATDCAPNNESEPLSDSTASVDDIPSKKKKGGRRKKKVSGGSIAAVLILLIGIAAFSGLGYWRHEEYKAFAAMKEVVARQTFYEGTTVEGYNVSGLSLSQAVDYWNAQIEPAYRETAAVLNDGTRITAAQMGYTSDFESVLFNA